MALAFAVASSGNLPVVVLSLFWKVQHRRHHLGLVVGTVASIGLVMVSPNMTYPKAVKAAAQKVVDGAPARMAPITEALASGDAAKIAKAEKDKAALDKAVGAAKANLEKFKGDDTSIMGLEKPLFELRNPGLISIPLGFLAVILGSLLYRDKRSEDMWDELYVRQTTGILAAKATAH